MKRCSSADASPVRLVGPDGGLASVMDVVRSLRSSTTPVLLQGEFGTGKETIARLLHAESPAHSGPFSRVSCAALSRELTDAELFGHEEGAFAGAQSSRPGWLERVNGGTLFLDEIGELPLGSQVRLLRVTQDGTFTRVGGGRPITVSVRLVTGTQRDLSLLTDAGSFRRDLYDRLSATRIVLPPLRERLEDIPSLAAYFVERAAARFGLRPVPVSDEDLLLLSAHHWPGNLREMAEVIDRAVRCGHGRRLEIRAALGPIAVPQANPPVAKTSPLWREQK